MNRSVLQTIRNGMDTFSKGQKRIANYILENYDKAAFMTASKLGQTAQVSESTVCASRRSWAITATLICRRSCRS